MCGREGVTSRGSWGSTPLGNRRNPREQGWAQGSQQVKADPLPLSVEKAELAPCPAHAPHPDLRLLSPRRGRSGCSSNRDHAAWKVQIIYSLALKRRSLLTPDVEHPREGREAEYLFTLLVLGCPGVISSPALPSCPQAI